MSDAEIVASAGLKSENGVYILRRLPPWMPTGPDTGNFKLLDAVGRAIDRLDGDITEIDRANTVQHAETVAQLVNLAKLIDLPPEENEPIEKYRRRTIAEFQTTTTETTIADLIGNTATLLDLAPEEIGYSRPSENGVVRLQLPQDSPESVSLSETEFIEIAEKHVAAGFRLEVLRDGTFTYVAESAYSGPYDAANGGYDSTKLDSDSTIGYDGLDANGNPKGNGGTYAGFID